MPPSPHLLPLAHPVRPGGRLFSEIADHLIIISLIAVILILAALLISVVLQLRRTRSKNEADVLLDRETGIGNLQYFVSRFKDIADAAKEQYFVTYFILDTNLIMGLSNYADVVKYLASTLRERTGQHEIAARITDNGFAFALKCADEQLAANRAGSVIDAVNRFVGIDAGATAVYAAYFHLRGSDRDAESVLFNLRRVCNTVFGTGRRMILCNGDSLDQAYETEQLFGDIGRGIDNGEFKLYLQFVIDRKSKRIVSAEALSRRLTADGELQLPVRFIAAMEAGGLIERFDFYMFDKVCRQLESWKGTALEPLLLSCNFTRVTISGRDFVKKIERIAGQYDFDHAKLIMEITEDALESDFSCAVENVRRCKRLGFVIALDDLGSGITSLKNLCDFPIDIVKLDRDILRRCNRENGKELYNGLIYLAHQLRLMTVSEGVEDPEQEEFISGTECDLIQGFYYFKPIPADEVDIEEIGKQIVEQTIRL